MTNPRVDDLADEQTFPALLPFRRRPVQQTNKVNVAAKAILAHWFHDSAIT